MASLLNSLIRNLELSLKIIDFLYDKYIRVCLSRNDSFFNFFSSQFTSHDSRYFLLLNYLTL